MKLKRMGVAGTLESSDVMITVEPRDAGISIDLQSPVDVYYRDAMLSAIRESLEESGVDGVELKAVDHGALDCTIRARVKTALRRAMEGEEI